MVWRRWQLRPLGACLLSLVLGMPCLFCAVARAEPPATQQPAATDPAARPDCRLDDSDPRPARALPPPAPSPRQRVPGCGLAAKDALARLRAGQLLLIDVRPAAQFERYRIAGSLNIAPAFVKTKSFLAGQPFALVGEGRAQGDLEALCTSLRRAGFSQAKVMDGGLLAWRKAKGPIEGDLLEQRSLTRMSAAEFAQERASTDWLVVDLTDATAKDVQSWLPGAVRVPSTRDDTKLATNIKTVAAKRVRKGRPQRLLIVDMDGSRRERLEPVLSRSLSQDVLFLDGGLAGWKKYWAEQNAIWAAAQRGPRRPKCGA
jgi:rhodanese-related sulfurtransferase